MPLSLEPLRVNDQGVVEGVRYIPSPNCDDRPSDCHVSLLVVHNISLPPGEFGGDGVIDFFTNRLDADIHPYYQTIKDLRVSAHFFIRRGGEIIQFVPCGKRAWHAGESMWRGRGRCNDFSIGVELEGTDTLPFTEFQYASVIELARALKTRYPLPDIAGHSDIAPGRKADPGPCFDWARLRTALADTPAA